MAKPNNNTLYKNCVEPFLPDMSGSGGPTVVYANELTDVNDQMMYLDPECTKPVPNSMIGDLFDRGMVIHIYNSDHTTYMSKRPYKCNPNAGYEYVEVYDSLENVTFIGADE